MPEIFNLMDHFVKKARTAQLLEDSVLYSFLGRRRAGKSTLTLAVLKKCDPDMTVDQIVFTNKEFREAVKEYKGRAIMWDEPGVTAYSREYQDEANRLLNKTLQVFGFKKLIIGLAYQHAGFLDKHTRWLVDVYFICRSEIIPDELRRQNYVEPMVLITDWLREPTLVPYKIKRNGRLVEMGTIKVPALEDLFKWAGMNKKFYKEYEKKKLEFFEKAEWEKSDKEEEREKRAREEFMRWLREARELERVLCHKCVFWFREGRYCVAVNEGRYSLLFKPEEGVCKDFIEEIATIEWWAPESWLKLGWRGKMWLLCSAASCGPYEYGKRAIALTTRVAFTDEEVRALVEALESGKSGPFEVIEPENERGLCVLRRTDRRNELFYFPPESVKKIRAVLGEVIR